MSSILRQFLLKSVQNFGRNRILMVPKVVSGRRCLPSWGPPPKEIDRKDIEFRVLQTLGKHDKIDLNSVLIDIIDNRFNL